MRGGRKHKHCRTCRVWDQRGRARLAQLRDETYREEMVEAAAFRVTLDDASFDTLTEAIAKPAPPTAALVALFRRA